MHNTEKGGGNIHTKVSKPSPKVTAKVVQAAEVSKPACTEGHREGGPSCVLSTPCLHKNTNKKALISRQFTNSSQSGYEHLPGNPRTRRLCLGRAAKNESEVSRGYERPLPRLVEPRTRRLPRAAKKVANIDPGWWKPTDNK